MSTFSSLIIRKTIKIGNGKIASIVQYEPSANGLKTYMVLLTDFLVIFTKKRVRSQNSVVRIVICPYNSKLLTSRSYLKFYIFQFWLLAPDYWILISYVLNANMNNQYFVWFTGSLNYLLLLRIFTVLTHVSIS